MEHKANKKGKLLLEAFDTLFIMILCFGTLLTAMIMKSEVMGGMKYSINYITLTITLLAVSIYLYFVLHQSDKGLKSMIQQLYGESRNGK